MLHFRLTPFVFFLSNHVEAKQTKAPVFGWKWQPSSFVIGCKQRTKGYFLEVGKACATGVWSEKDLENSSFKRTLRITNNHNESPTFSPVLLEPFCKLLNNSPSSLHNLFGEIQMEPSHHPTYSYGHHLSNFAQHTKMLALIGNIPASNR